MRIVVVADGRSNITRNWLLGMKEMQHEIFLISTFPCEKPAFVEKMVVLPVAFSSFAGSQVKTKSTIKRENIITKLSPYLRSIFLKLRHSIGPLTLRFYKHRFQTLVNQIEPQVVHALRIPFEGMLASFTPACYPVIISTWGNDLTFHASGSAAMAIWTRRALMRSDAIMADTHRDLEIAKEWGLNPSVPKLFVPGNGGLDLSLFTKREIKKIPDYFIKKKFHVINPRGFRPGSVHNETIFKAIPLIIKEIPDVQFLCPAMKGQQKAQNWIQELKIEQNVTLLPYLKQDELWDIYSLCDIYVSLSSHDGTPNTFLEAIACGCFPIVGDIESLREWVIEGESGHLVNPLDEKETAERIIAALKNTKLRANAKQANQKILKIKAERKAQQKKIADFYEMCVVD